MKLVVHDFAGHPGQLQLSRELARRGHVVEHHYCQSVATGQGATVRRSAFRRTAAAVVAVVAVTVVRGRTEVRRPGSAHRPGPQPRRASAARRA